MITVQESDGAKTLEIQSQLDLQDGESLVESFEFGQADTHLVFSHPVKMEIEVQAPDGTQVELGVQHE